MGRHPKPLAADIVVAWNELKARGGPETLPPVIRRRDLVDLFPAMYRFDAARRAGLVPGDQMVPGGVWRVDRSLFIEWLQRHLPQHKNFSDADVLYYERQQAVSEHA